MATGRTQRGIAEMSGSPRVRERLRRRARSGRCRPLPRLALNSTSLPERHDECRPENGSARTSQKERIMTEKLKGKRYAILATNGFEQSELEEPKKALEAAGAKAEVVSLSEGQIRGWKHTDWGSSVAVDVTIARANPDQYDGLVLPGGVINPDKLRIEPEAVDFVRAFAQSGKPIAAICHGPWTLINAGAVRGRKMTSWPSLQADLQNAGAEWVDEQVVVDQGLVTSRKPDDLPAFNRKMIEEFAEGRHQRRNVNAAE
jgi:protease I